LTATKLIRKHPNPEIRNILIIAMTASAIQGDREKCLESGMNNYLAKPVRAQTLKALLESYLHREGEGGEKSIPNLDSEAKKLVKEALSEVDGAVDGVEADKAGGETRRRPGSVRKNTAVRWRGREGEKGGKRL
jgi:DNA-binding response OmpR family regulator